MPDEDCVEAAYEIRRLTAEKEELRVALGEALYSLGTDDYVEQQAVAAKLAPLLN